MGDEPDGTVRPPAHASASRYFYGFIGGETNQHVAALYEGTTAIEPPRTPDEGHPLTEDLADHAIAWMRQQNG